TLQKDDDDEISNLVDLHMGMLGGGWKWQDLQSLLRLSHPPLSLERISSQNSVRLIQCLYAQEQARELLLHLIFIFSCELRTSSRVPSILYDRNPTMLQSFDLMVHDFQGLLNELKFVGDMQFFQ
ncbi:hypothetical protein Tco_0385085, partial [Tanacetum coccineum]